MKDDNDKTPAAEFAYHFPNHMTHKSRVRLYWYGIIFTIAQVLIVLLLVLLHWLR